MSKIITIVFIGIFVYAVVQMRESSKEDQQKVDACAAQGGTMRGDICTKFEAPK